MTDLAADVIQQRANRGSCDTPQDVRNLIARIRELEAERQDAELDCLNSGSDSTAELLRAIAENGRESGAFASKRVEAAAQAILALRETLRRRTELGMDLMSNLESLVGEREIHDCPSLFTLLVKAKNEFWPATQSAEPIVYHSGVKSLQPRCPICGWPLVTDPSQGCTAQSCSQRPKP